MVQRTVIQTPNVVTVYAFQKLLRDMFGFLIVLSFKQVLSYVMANTIDHAHSAISVQEIVHALPTEPGYAKENIILNAP